MDLIKVNPLKTEDTLFLYYALKTPSFKAYAESASTGTTVLHLSKKAVDKFKMIYPSEIEILKFNQLIEPIIKIQRNIINQNNKLASIRDTLLPKLMAGEIDIANISIED